MIAHIDMMTVGDQKHVEVKVEDSVELVIKVLKSHGFSDENVQGLIVQLEERLPSKQKVGEFESP